jgi:hypothetical protein
MKIKPGRKSPSRPAQVGDSQARSTNIPIIPASQLAHMAKWRQQARSLNGGEMLFVLPVDNRRLETAARKIKVAMSKHGRPLIIRTIH